MNNNEIAIVIPTIRIERINALFTAWGTAFKGCTVLLIEDNPTHSSFKSLSAGIDVRHYAWDDIGKVLKTDAHIISKRSDAIRCFGFLQAYKAGFKYIYSLDDDCYGDVDVLAAHYENVCHKVSLPSWWSTIKGGYPRGYPYGDTRKQIPVVISHGGWRNVADLDAVSQLTRLREGQTLEIPMQVGLVPAGQHFSMCAMNVFFQSSAVPMMYNPPMGEGEPFSRFGDIWCGLIAKKVCDHLGLGIWSGHPTVEHIRASDPFVSLKQEAAGLHENESFYHWLDEIVLTSTTIDSSIRQICTGLATKGDYWHRFAARYQIWLKLLK